MSNAEVTASVIIVNYNGRDDLEECLPSVLNQSVPLDEYEIILVDNDSTDGSVGFVREAFPEVKIIANNENRWYAGGNNDGFGAARGEYLVVLNPDVVVDRQWLEMLVKPFESQENIGLTTPRIVMYNDCGELNTCGNDAHFTGLGFCRGRHEPVDSYESREKVPAVSGCSFAIPRRVYKDIGGFDESFEYYYEDLDLSWRAHLAGYDLLYVPDSVVYHKYNRIFPPWRFFNMERNRMLILLKHLRWRTLILLLPALVLTELAMVLYAMVRGPKYLREKVRAWWWVTTHRPRIKKDREQVQQLRKRSDAEILSQLNTAIPFTQFGVPDRLSSALNTGLSVIYRPIYWLTTR